MASTLREEEPFATHHRMHVSLAEVLSWLGLGFGFGLANPNYNPNPNPNPNPNQVLSASEDHQQWRFRRFGYLRDWRWLEAPQSDNVQVR